MNARRDGAAQSHRALLNAAARPRELRAAAKRRRRSSDSRAVADLATSAGG
jgi:hypothetical protein